MGQALYRKYRSKKMKDVVGQDHVVKVLEKAIKDKKISHAYLFSGPRGVGKTSVARILAHEVSGLDYSPDNVHLDIIEIDAASNRRIDEIRDLRDKVNILPAAAHYKVYIIDEVHMLTKEAFNALLKTLEEPPKHCIFILATTESHKLPDTIISRTQRFNFKPVAGSVVAGHLKLIAKAEKIDITPGALELLGKHADGSLRDGISLLDQLSNSPSQITEHTVRQNLGIPESELVEGLLSAVYKNDAADILKLLDEAKTLAINPTYIASELSAAIRLTLVRGNQAPYHASLLKNLLSVSASPDPYESLEISLLDAVDLEPKNDFLPAPPQSNDDLPQVDTDIEKVSAGESRPQNTSVNRQSFDITNWPRVVELVRKEAASLYTALRLAVPELSGDTLTLRFQFPLHQKKISRDTSKMLIGELIENQFGAKLEIKCVVDKSIQPAVESEPARNTGHDETAKSINNIFGPTELLESGEIYG